MSREYLTSEEQDLISDPQSFAAAHHGERIKLMDKIYIPGDWLIDGGMRPELWEKIKIPVIPLMPVKARSATAGRDLKRTRENFGEDAFYLIFEDESRATGWRKWFVLPDDLGKEGEVLKREHQEATESGEPFLVVAKEVAYIITTGLQDIG